MTKLSSNACLLHDLSFSEGIALLAIAATDDEEYKALIDKGLISTANNTLRELNKRFHVSDKGITLANELIADSEEAILNKKNEIEELAIKLREIYPEGKMPGTSYYYRGNKADIIKKLKSFYKRYGTEYTSDQIIEATKKYIQSFNGNYTYLKLLKYFIWKDEVRDGEAIQTSILADCIENKDSTMNNNWSSTLI